MKQAFLTVAIGAVVASGVGVAHAQEMAMQMDHVSGVLVDTKCYGMMPEANAGDDHTVVMDGNTMSVPDCATACANLGIPVGLLRDGQPTLVLAAPAGQLSPHMAEQVELHGVYSKDKATFIVMRVVPENGEAYDITTMM